MKRPHIVLTMADDQQASAISALGSQAQTSVLDQMIAEGSCFTQAHHFGSCHGAVCAPSRAMLHTGRTYFNLPTLLHTNPKTFKTAEEKARVAKPSESAAQADVEAIKALPMLGELLGASGYQTFASGKWHNGKMSFNKSFQHGANIFFGGMSDHDGVPLHQYDASGSYSDEDIVVGEGFSTDLFVEAAVDAINHYDSDAPLFLLLAFTAPHDPRTPLPEYRDMYAPEAIDLPANVLPEHPFDNGELYCRDELLAAHPRPLGNVKQQLAEYYGMISHMDTGIGQVRDALQARGLLADTLFIHTGDHGLAVGQHGLFGKQNLYEHSIKTPLIMSGPGVPQGQQSDALVYQHDLFPTLLEAAQLAPPEGCEFSSLWPLLQQAHAPQRETLVSSYRLGQRMVKDGRFKLIRYYQEDGQGSDRVQLFNYHDDPLEQVDLSTRAEDQEKIRSLDVQLLDWMRHTHDPLMQQQALRVKGA